MGWKAGGGRPGRWARALRQSVRSATPGEGGGNDGIVLLLSLAPVPGRGVSSAHHLAIVRPAANPVPMRTGCTLCLRPLRGCGAASQRVHVAPSTKKSQGKMKERSHLNENVLLKPFGVRKGFSGKAG